MLRRIVSDLASNTIRRRVFALCTSSVFIVTVSLVACASPTSIVEPSMQAEPTPLLAANLEPAQTTIPEPAPTLTPTTFQISDLEISPAEVNSGEEFLITANLANAGDSEATQTIELMVDNIAKLVTEVTLPAGETGELRVVGQEEVPGTYTVSLNGLIGQFTVTESAETLILGSPDPGTFVPDQNTSGCCGGGDGSTNQSGCGCGGEASSQSSGGSSNRSGCGCGG